MVGGGWHPRSVFVCADSLVTATGLHDGVGVLAGRAVLACQLNFPFAGGLLLATGALVHHCVGGHGVSGRASTGSCAVGHVDGHVVLTVIHLHHNLLSLLLTHFARLACLTASFSVGGLGARLAVVGVVLGTLGLGLNGGGRAGGVVAGVLNTVLTWGRPRLVLHDVLGVVISYDTVLLDTCSAASGWISLILITGGAGLDAFLVDAHGGVQAGLWVRLIATGAVLAGICGRNRFSGHIHTTLDNTHFLGNAGGGGAALSTGLGGVGVVSRRASGDGRAQAGVAFALLLVAAAVRGVDHLVAGVGAVGSGLHGAGHGGALHAQGVVVAHAVLAVVFPRVARLLRRAIGSNAVAGLDAEAGGGVEERGAWGAVAALSQHGGVLPAAAGLDLSVVHLVVPGVACRLHRWSAGDVQFATGTIGLALSIRGVPPVDAHAGLGALGGIDREDSAGLVVAGAHVRLAGFHVWCRGHLRVALFKHTAGQEVTGFGLAGCWGDTRGGWVCGRRGRRGSGCHTGCAGNKPFASRVGALLQLPVRPVAVIGL